MRGRVLTLLVIALVSACARVPSVLGAPEMFARCGERLPPSLTALEEDTVLTMMRLDDGVGAEYKGKARTARQDANACPVEAARLDSARRGIDGLPARAFHCLDG